MDKESEAKKQESELLSEVGEDTTKYGEFISSYFAMGIITTTKRESK